MKQYLKEKLNMRNSIILLALLIGPGLYLLGANPGLANSLSQSAQEGQTIFQTNCAACHTIGKGDLVGPDLQEVTQRRDQAWLTQMIAAPDKLLSSGDPIAQELFQKYKVAMPNLGLSDTQVQSLLAYLEAPGGASAAVAVLTGGQAVQGRALFTGQTPFTNRGTPCIACHSTTGISAVGGGVLGPDLTHIYGRLGDAGLSSALVALPYPTMRGVFVNAPLTPQEQADLFAYFQETELQPVQVSSINTNLVWGMGAAGALILFGGMLVFWPRQRQSISARLRKSV